MAQFAADEGLAIERVKVPKSSMRAVSVASPLPASITARKIKIKFPGALDATLTSLVQTLSASKVQIAFKWSNPEEGEELLSRKLPFLSFEGSIGELMSTLRTGMGVASWYENGVVYLSNQDRYAVTLPQNEEILKSVKSELEELGARNVLTSLNGGKVIYTAAPTTQDHVIGPFLSRMARNLSVINMQVAVISLSLTDKTESGFDWNKFRIAFASSPDGIKSLTTAEKETTTGTGTGTGSGDSEDEGDEPTEGGLIGKAVDLTSGGLSLSRTKMGNVFGTYGALSVAGAVSFLSNFGQTTITQNVSLKTLSGTAVKLQSGQEIPYVKGVSNTTTSNSNNTTGSTDTDTVETGLIVEMSPFFDADAELVTVGVDVKLDEVTDWVELSAGNEIGTLTQPVIQKQNMNDIVRLQAGRTVVIGGLQYNNDASSGVEPALLRRALEGTGKTTGKRARDISRNALFIAIRPTLTIYETEE